MGTPVPSPRRGQQVVATDRHVYLLGGANSMLLDEVWFAVVAPDGTIGLWMPTVSLPAPRYIHNAVLHAGRIFVVAGSVAGVYSTEVISAGIQSDGSLDSWVTHAPISVPRAEASAIVAGDFLYVVGGQNGVAYDDVQLARFEADGGLGPWSVTTPMGRPRWGHAGVAYNGRLHVSGGQADSTVGVNLNETISAPILADGTLGAWTTGSPLSRARRNFSLRAENGSLWAIGGANQTDALRDDSVEAATVHADGTLGTWISVSRFTTGRRHPSTASIHGVLFVCCGIGEPGQTHIGDVQLARISGPHAKSAYTMAVDVGPSALSIDSVTLNGSMPAGTRLWATTQVETDAGVYGPGKLVGPVTLGSPIDVSLTARHLRVSLFVDSVAALAHDPDATDRGTLSSIEVRIIEADPPDAGVDAGLLDAGVDAGVLDAGVLDAGAVDASVPDAGVVDAGTVDGGGDGGRIDAGPGDGGIQDRRVLAVGCSCGDVTSLWAGAIAMVFIALRRRNLR